MPSSVNPRLLAFGGLTAMACALGIGRFIYTPILPHMVEDLHLSKGAAGLIASANFLGYLVGALMAAAPSARSASRFGLLAALAVSALTTAAMGWPGGRMDTFLIWRFLGGAASAYVLVLSSALVIERLTAAGQGQLSAIHFAGVGTGIAVSSVLTWLLETVTLDWRAMWIGGGVLSLAGLVAVAVWVPKAESVTAADDSTAAAPIDGRLKDLTLAYGLFGFGYVITATFIVAIVRGSPSASQIEPVFWLAFGLSAMASVTLWLRVGEQLGIMKAFAIACIVEALGVFASAASPGVAGLLIASILVGGTFMGLTALGLVAARNLAPGNAKQWLAILTAAFGLGQIVGPIVAGYGYDLTGSFVLPSMLAVVALCVSGYLAFAIERTPSA